MPTNDNNIKRSKIKILKILHLKYMLNIIVELQEF